MPNQFIDIGQSAREELARRGLRVPTTLAYALLIAVLEDWLLHQDRHESGIDAAGVRAQLATLRTLAR